MRHATLGVVQQLLASAAVLLGEAGAAAAAASGHSGGGGGGGAHSGGGGADSDGVRAEWAAFARQLCEALRARLPEPQVSAILFFANRGAPGQFP